LRELSLRAFIAPLLESGSVRYFEPYEGVHRGNIAMALAAHAGK
jgi:hypothetical protein